LAKLSLRNYIRVSIEKKRDKIFTKLTGGRILAGKVSVIKQIRGLKANFWFANWLEANERLAFFGIRAILPLYMVAAVANNGLGLSYTDKGMIYGIWALVQCLVPMVSGGFTDAYGYKKSLYVAYTINIIGYLAFAFATGFASTLLAACLVGLGTAIFKPPISGTVAKASTEENSSIAWGIFYWMVNVGGFLAPLLSAVIRGENNWQLVFFCAAGVTAFNFLPTIFFYQEPERSADFERKSVAATLKEILSTLKDKNFMIFLGIFSGFWFMFMQLWDLLPNFIDEWVFSTDIAPFFAKLSPSLILASGNIKPEVLINIDSFAIILFMLPMAWLTGKFHPMIALIGGMLISLVGFMMSGGSNVGFVVAIAIFIFAIGEMWCSPKFSEYIGLTAPADKKALYMGYSNIPFAIGWGVGNAVSGPLYENMGSKINFAREYLIDEFGMPAAQVADIPTEKVMETMAQYLNNGQGGTIDDATRILWSLNDPWMVWVILTAIGSVSTLSMVAYYFKTRKSGISSNA
jgi:proton-dependent oligopeptide transporter, POT family